MTIKVGEKIPSVKLHEMTADGIKEVTTDEFFGGKKVVVFGLPGAFTPTCSAKHLPGFVAKADDIRAKGVDAIACVSVNDPFVMDAWGKAHEADGKVVMLADGNGDFARAIGLDQDMSARGFGLRSRRYAMIVEDGVVRSLHVEEGPGALEVSGAESILAEL